MAKNSKSSQVEEKFSDFFEKWFCELEELLSQLLRAGKEKKASELAVSNVTRHVKAYYTAKWAAAREDALAFFSPIWLSPLEKAFQWVTGWKPSTVFRLVEKKELREEQRKRIEELRVKIRLEEEKVEREMERQQVAMADRKTVELVTVGGSDVDVETAVRGIIAGLERVMKAADCVRLKALKGLLDELSPPQCVEFLAAHSLVLLQLRHSGTNLRSSSSSTTTIISTTYSCSSHVQSNRLSPSTPT